MSYIRKIFICTFLSLNYILLQAQGWTDTEKKNFKEECLKNLINQKLIDEAKPTCDCILSKFLIKFPRAQDAVANGPRRLPKITLQCLPTSGDGNWHPLIQRQFFETCMELSTPKSSIYNSKDFCLCMVGKFQQRYKQHELLNLNEIEKASEMENAGLDCNIPPTPNNTPAQK